jgi:hypothetical protein
MKTAVLGTGSWGTALAQILCDNGQDVILWGVDPGQVEDINTNHHNSAYYDDPINPDLKASSDMNVIQDADIILAAVPTMALEEVLTKAAAIVNHPVIVINVAKGFHPKTHERLSVVIRPFLLMKKQRKPYRTYSPTVTSASTAIPMKPERRSGLPLRMSWQSLPAFWKESGRGPMQERRLSQEAWRKWCASALPTAAGLRRISAWMA